MGNNRMHYDTTPTVPIRLSIANTDQSDLLRHYASSSVLAPTVGEQSKPTVRHLSTSQQHPPWSLYTPLEHLPSHILTHSDRRWLTPTEVSIVTTAFFQTTLTIDHRTAPSPIIRTVPFILLTIHGTSSSSSSFSSMDSGNCISPAKWITGRCHMSASGSVDSSLVTSWVEAG